MTTPLTHPEAGSLISSGHLKVDCSAGIAARCEARQGPRDGIRQDASIWVSRHRSSPHTERWIPCIVANGGTRPGDHAQYRRC
jgi:hypothetical protein